MGLGVPALPCRHPPYAPRSLGQGLVPWGWETPLPPQPSSHWDGFPILRRGPALSTLQLGRVWRGPVMVPACTRRCGARERGTGQQPPRRREALSPHGARFSHRHTPKSSLEPGGWRAASAATGSGQGALALVPLDWGALGWGAWGWPQSSAWSHRHGRTQPPLCHPDAGGRRTPGWRRHTLRVGVVLICRGIRCAAMAKNVGS